MGAISVQQSQDAKVEIMRGVEAKNTEVFQGGVIDVSQAELGTFLRCIVSQLLQVLARVPNRIGRGHCVLSLARRSNVFRSLSALARAAAN